jgi:ribonuclease J
MKFIDSGLIIATTFSTHIERMQSLVDEAVKYDRTPIIMGRSFSKQVEVSERFGLLNLPPNARVCASPKAIKHGLKEIGRKEDYMLIVTGHQGEPGSVISRIADGRLPSRLGKGDSALLCANIIPSPLNHASRYTLETRLKQRGVRIFDGIHVSGHASKEEHRKMLRLIRPEHIIPCHGTMEMRSAYASLAAEEGYNINKQTHIIVNGSSIDI